MKRYVFMYFYTKKKVTSLAIVLTILTGCGGGSTETTTSTERTPTSTETTPTSNETTSTSNETTSTSTPTSKAVHSGQVKDSSTGNALADVKVSLGKSTTTTDENGFYSLSDLITSEEVVVNFEKEGYLIGSTQIQLKSLSGDDTISSNYLEKHL